MRARRHGIRLWAALLLVLLTLSGLCHAQTDKVTYVYTDPQGTPLAEADAQGNITARYDYTPYGTSVPSLSAPPNGPGYTGHVNDPETGLVYMQARYYQPTGRFLSPDPVGPAAGNIYSFNRYAYASNNPVKNIDPDGRESADLTLRGVAALQSDTQNMSPQQARVAIGMAVSFVPVAGDAQNVVEAYNNPSIGNIAIAVLGAIPEIGAAAADTVKGASAVERATAIAGTMSERTQRSVTIAVTETKEGTRVVSSSEGALRPAARAALTDGEVASKGVAGVHAEVNGINSARDMGLTPTGSAASRPICPSCAQQLEQQGVKPLSTLKQPGS